MPHQKYIVKQMNVCTWGYNVSRAEQKRCVKCGVSLVGGVSQTVTTSGR